MVCAVVETRRKTVDRAKMDRIGKRPRHILLFVHFSVLCLGLGIMREEWWLLEGERLFDAGWLLGVRANKIRTTFSHITVYVVIPRVGLRFRLI